MIPIPTKCHKCDNPILMIYTRTLTEEFSNQIINGEIQNYHKSYKLTDFGGCGYIECEHCNKVVYDQAFDYTINHAKYVKCFDPIPQRELI